MKGNGLTEGRQKALISGGIDTGGHGADDAGPDQTGVFAEGLGSRGGALGLGGLRGLQGAFAGVAGQLFQSKWFGWSASHEAI